MDEVIIYLCPSVRQLLPCGKPPFGRQQRGEPQRQLPAPGNPPSVLAPFGYAYGTPDGEHQFPLVGKPACRTGFTATHARVHLWFLFLDVLHSTLEAL
ncbi:hypothetical protein [Scytonema sp. PCC 10023]|uniref:hypothetical protein n=1 Tax=Scytonema sp. PCC 10023 TaxID=1680591 RepID=UPI0039C648B0